MFEGRKKIGVPAQEEREFTLLPFCSIPALSDAQHIGEGDLSYSVYGFKCYCLLETPSHTVSEMFYQLSGHPVAQLMHKIIHHKQVALQCETEAAFNNFIVYFLIQTIITCYVWVCQVVRTLQNNALSQILQISHMQVFFCDIVPRTPQ